MFNSTTIKETGNTSNCSDNSEVTAKQEKALAQYKQLPHTFDDHIGNTDGATKGSKVDLCSSHSQMYHTSLQLGELPSEDDGVTLNEHSLNQQDSDSKCAYNYTTND